MSALQDAGRGLGILGGTFNPPHLGHLRLAQAALAELELERVLLVPAHAAPHKAQEDDPGAEHRLRMCELAARTAPRVDVSRIELDRPGPSYTVDTLRSIHATDPDAELTLIVGADMAQTLPSWREPDEILRLARVAVAGRDGTSRERAQSAIASLGAEARTVFLDMPLLDVSSSQIRSQVAAGEPYEDLVGTEVAGYIAQHGLYREARA